MTQLAVLIATKNRPDSLKKAIRSITWQTQKPDTILVISDCDPENEKRTEEIIQKFDSRFSDIRLIKNQRIV